MFYSKAHFSKASQSSHDSPKARDSLKPSRGSTSNPQREKPQQACYPIGQEIGRQLARKRKRSQEAEDQVSQVQEKPTKKGVRTSPASCAAENKEAVDNTDNKEVHPIDHWLQIGHWPKEYFEPGSHTWEDLGADREAEKLAEELQRREEWGKKQAAKVKNMAHPLLPMKRSSASIRRQYEELGIEPPSDLPREEKSVKYRSPAYEKELADKGSFMYESKLGITEDSKSLCRDLLSSAQTAIQDSLFSDDRFETACQKIHNENEAMVLQDITRLIVPSAKNLATCGATGLNYLVESVDKGWNSAIPITNPRPQPDYSVAFGQSAFTDKQVEQLKPFVGDLLRQPTEFSYFMATWKMYFPFLTCEVKCGAAALDVADRQNAHSMTHALRAVVQLYRYAKWEEGFDWKKEIHREILAFSVSHDDRAVRIYGHYPVIEDDRTTFYRHPIRAFILTDLDGRDKWTAYKFTKNVYELWMPRHLKRICKAINALPLGLDFSISSASFRSVISAENDAMLLDSQERTTSTPKSQDTATFKKPRLTTSIILRQQLAERDERLAQEKEESKQRHTELMEQLKESQQRLAQEKEESKQRHTELMEQLRESQQRLDQEKKENKELMTQLKELMSFLKQRKSSSE